MEPCNCIQIVDAKLAEHNTRLKLPIFFTAAGEDPRPTRLFVATEKATEKRGKPVSMFANYCPFCGVRYEPGSAEPAK